MMRPARGIVYLAFAGLVVFACGSGGCRRGSPTEIAGSYRFSDGRMAISGSEGETVRYRLVDDGRRTSRS